MGRYTTVQAYADNNSAMRSVSYEQATGRSSSEGGGGVVKTERVDNPYGSTAGAGSGEFHVYRHARAREMARVSKMDQDEKEALADKEFQEKVSHWKQEEEDRTSKRRKKRQRERDAKLRKKNLHLGGVLLATSTAQAEEKKEVQTEEFDYTPLYTAEDDANDKKPTMDSTKGEDSREGNHETVEDPTELSKKRKLTTEE